jgi:hypothetical protein
VWPVVTTTRHRNRFLDEPNVADVIALPGLYKNNKNQNKNKTFTFILGETTVKKGKKYEMK